MEKSMEIEISPMRLKKMFESVFNAKKSDSSLVVFKPSGLESNCQLSSDLFVYAKYDKSYFVTYNVTEDREMMVTKPILEEVNDGFKTEKVKIELTDEHFIMSEPSEGRIRVKIDAVDPNRKTPFDMTKSEVGLVASLNGRMSVFIAQMLVPVDRFTSFRSVETVKLVFDGQELKVEASKELSDREQKVPIKRLMANAKPFKMEFQYETLKTLFSQFTGEVWISINEQGINISQINADYMLTYMFARVVSGE